MTEKLFRVTIIVQEYYDEGFWNVFDKTEMLKGKDELLESFIVLSNDCKKYIESRLK